MLYGLLNADPSRFIEDFGEIGLYALIGFIVVFSGIAFLIFIVWLVGKLLSKGNVKNASQSKTTVDIPQTPLSPEPVLLENDDISEETLAIITAAIMAYYEKNNPKCEFTLKRIKRM
ncbi:MAG: hypothetical protein E7349_05125 [Clostridiales bacterium]|nr:hypothetical protein [Clostridiales bacterium]